MIGVDTKLIKENQDFTLQRRWNSTLLRELFTKSTVPNINKICQPDQAIRLPSSFGNFLKNHSVFFIIRRGFHEQTILAVDKSIGKACGRWKWTKDFGIFLWRCATESLPWFLKMEDQCPLCETSFDKEDHTTTLVNASMIVLLVDNCDDFYGTRNSWIK